MAAQNVAHSSMRITARTALVVFFCLSLFVVLPTVARGISANSYLDSLSVEGFELSPVFRKTTLIYQLEVPEDVAFIKIDARAEDADAQLTITGADALSIGDNEVRVRVTAADSSHTEYQIKVRRLGQVAADNVYLRTLEVGDYTLSPPFSFDVFEYSLDVSDQTEKLDIDAFASNDHARVSISGADNLLPGENTVTISVTSASGDDEQIYSIQVLKPEPIDHEAYADYVAKKTWTSRGYYVAALVAIVLSMLGVVTWRLARKRRS